ncbi:MAG: hypothetical protein JWO97_2483 [Acidobacteria bacterium]|nr:hypothetical protein [Acidobacteriota bacterium]
MRKRSTSLITITAIILALFPGGQLRSSPTESTVYTQWYDCIIGPYPGITGRWVRDCHNNWYGWGDQPGASCTFTVESEEECQ